MTDSWEVTSQTKEYKDAITATTSLPADKKAEGFVQPESVGAKGFSYTIKQNNTILQAVITLSRSVTELREQVATLQQEVRNLKRPEVKLPEDALEELTRKIGGLKISEGKGKSKVIGPGTDDKLYVYCDPRDILKEERAKLKK